LRATIAAASSGDTIVFANSLKNKTITLTSGQLAVSKSLDIEGLGAKHLAISGNHASRVFDMSGSASVTLAGLTITHGLATMGGGILNEGGATLSISNCTLNNNKALSNAGSGGIGGAIEDNCAVADGRGPGGAATIAEGQYRIDKGLTVGKYLVKIQSSTTLNRKVPSPSMPSHLVYQEVSVIPPEYNTRSSLIREVSPVVR